MGPSSMPKAWLLIGCCLTNGKRREEQSRWDMHPAHVSDLVNLQRRLACYGIDTREPTTQARYLRNAL